jgi:hypothetical protein
MRKNALPTPFPRSYWVIPGMFLAGEFPGAKNQPEAINKLGQLIDCGIRTFINLMQPNETDHSGNCFNEYEQNVLRIAAKKISPLPACDSLSPT